MRTVADLVVQVLVAREWAVCKLVLRLTAEPRNLRLFRQNPVQFERGPIVSGCGGKARMCDLILYERDP